MPVLHHPAMANQPTSGNAEVKNEPSDLLEQERPALSVNQKASIQASSPVPIHPGLSSKKSVVKPSTPVPKEDEFVKESIDISSIRGLFGWATVDGVSIPYLLREEKKYVAVRIVEQKLLARFPNTFPEELGKHEPLVSYYVTQNEMKLLDEINSVHCDFDYGHHKFTGKDLIVKLTEFEDFYNLVKKTFPKEVLHARKTGVPLPAPAVLASSKSGWIQVNNTVTPYFRRGLQKYVVLQIIRHAAKLLANIEVQSICPDEEEYNLINAMCTSAGLAFQFSKSTKLVSLEDVKLHHEVTLMELPLKSPMKYAQYNNSKKAEGQSPYPQANLPTAPVDQPSVMRTLAVPTQRPVQGHPMPTQNDMYNTLPREAMHPPAPQQLVPTGQHGQIHRLPVGQYPVNNAFPRMSRPNVQPQLQPQMPGSQQFSSIRQMRAAQNVPGFPRESVRPVQQNSTSTTVNSATGYVMSQRPQLSLTQNSQPLHPLGAHMFRTGIVHHPPQQGVQMPGAAVYNNQIATGSQQIVRMPVVPQQGMQMVGFSQHNLQQHPSMMQAIQQNRLPVSSQNFVSSMVPGLIRPQGTQQMPAVSSPFAPGFMQQQMQQQSSSIQTQQQRPPSQRPPPQQPPPQQPPPQRPIQQRPQQPSQLQPRPLHQSPLQQRPSQQSPLQQRPQQPSQLQPRPLQQNPLQQRPSQQSQLQGKPLQQSPLQQNPLQQRQLQQSPLQQNPLQQRQLQQSPLQQNPLQQRQLQQSLLQQSLLQQKLLQQRQSQKSLLQQRAPQPTPSQSRPLQPRPPQERLPQPNSMEHGIASAQPNSAEASDRMEQNQSSSPNSATHFVIPIVDPNQLDQDTIPNMNKILQQPPFAPILSAQQKVGKSPMNSKAGNVKTTVYPKIAPRQPIPREHVPFSEAITLTTDDTVVNKEVDNVEQDLSNGADKVGLVNPIAVISQEQTDSGHALVPNTEAAPVSLEVLKLSKCVSGVRFEGRSISCLEYDNLKGKHALVEAVCKLYFPRWKLNEFMYVLEQVLKIPTKACQPNEEKAFINYYHLPVPVLKCNKMVKLDDLSEHYTKLLYMFGKINGAAKTAADPGEGKPGDASGDSPVIVCETVPQKDGVSTDDGTGHFHREIVPVPSSENSTETSGGVKRKHPSGPTQPSKQLRRLEDAVERLKQRPDLSTSNSMKDPVQSPNANEEVSVIVIE